MIEFYEVIAYCRTPQDERVIYDYSQVTRAKLDELIARYDYSTIIYFCSYR